MEESVCQKVTVGLGAVKQFWYIVVLTYGDKNYDGISQISIRLL